MWSRTPLKLNCLSERHIWSSFFRATIFFLHRFYTRLRCPLTLRVFWEASTPYWWLFWVFRWVDKLVFSYAVHLLEVFFSYFFCFIDLHSSISDFLHPLSYSISISSAVTCFIQTIFVLQCFQESHLIIVWLYCTWLMLLFLCFRQGKLCCITGTNTGK